MPESFTDGFLGTVKLKIEYEVPKKNPSPPHGRLLEIPRGRWGVLKAKFSEAIYENKPKFPGGSRTIKYLSWGSIDIFWNCTIEIFME